MPLSGAAWVTQFPGTTRIADLVNPFRSNVQKFLTALKTAGVTQIISATFRPPERAYLMHHAFRIADPDDLLDPAKVKPMAGVDIQWVHRDPAGNPDIPTSRAKAKEMVKAYAITFRPSLTSRHTEGNAIDMTLTWTTPITIVDGTGASIVIPGPGKGATNKLLHSVGASYQVLKLVADPPHWSNDGR